MEKSCIICKENSIEVIEADSYIYLLFKVFGGTFKCNMNLLENRSAIVEEVLKTLTERERGILKKIYGLDGENPKSHEEMGALYSVTPERIRQIEAKSLRKLRHPSRSRVLRGDRSCPQYNRGYSVSNYIDRLEELLKAEIMGVVRGDGGKTLYLDNILRKNNIDIVNDTYDASYDDVTLDEMGFSVRTYNCLKRAGVTTLNELKDMDSEDLAKVRNLGRRCIEEIAEALQKYPRGTDGYNTIIFIRDGERTIYKYLDDDYEKISKSILHMILNKRDAGKDIFLSPFSPGLCELLLLRGYLYEGDVYEDADLLERQLSDFGFGDYAEEISKLKECFKSELVETERVYVCKAAEEIVDFVKDHFCTSIFDLKETAERCTRNDVLEFVEELDFEE